MFFIVCLTDKNYFISPIIGDILQRNSLYQPNNLITKFNVISDDLQVESDTDTDTETGKK